jgi:hypothetical protein
MRFLEIDNVYCGDSRVMMPQIMPDSVALSFWSPYKSGKECSYSASSIGGKDNG